MKDEPRDPQTFRTDLFQEMPTTWRNRDLRQALLPALAALIERVMTAAQEAGDDG